MLNIIFGSGFFADRDKKRNRWIRCAHFGSICCRWFLQVNFLSMMTPRYLVESCGWMVDCSIRIITGCLYFFRGCGLKWIISVFVGCNLSFHALHQRWNSSVDSCSWTVSWLALFDDVQRAVSSANSPCSVWFGMPFIESTVQMMYTQVVHPLSFTTAYCQIRRLWSYIVVFFRNTWLSITTVFFRVVYGGIRPFPNTAKVNRFNITAHDRRMILEEKVVYDPKRVVTFWVVVDRIQSWTIVYGVRNRRPGQQWRQMRSLWCSTFQLKRMGESVFEFDRCSSSA